jgi:hypothetical protein
MLSNVVPEAAAATPRPVGRLSPAVRLATSAAVVGACCYLGNLFDATVRFPRIGTAVFYPPYAVVTAALLLSPMRHWWLFLLASSLAHAPSARRSGFASAGVKHAHGVHVGRAREAPADRA